MLEINQIHQGDCMVLMKEIEDNSVDLILCDLPYGTTACEWDKVIPLEDLWNQYKKILKKDGVVVLTSSQPFTTDLINSNRDWFRYCWVWDKKKAGNIFLAETQPMKVHEDIVIFSQGTKYYPQKTNRREVKRSKNYGTGETMCGNYTKEEKVYEYSDKYPESILEFSNASQKNKEHPTQKPVNLFRYLIKTYTQEGELVLDNCIGSGTTAVACKQLNRNFIGIESNTEYVDICNKRLSQKTMFEIAEKRDTLNSYIEVSADSSQP